MMIDNFWNYPIIGFERFGNFLETTMNPLEKEKKKKRKEKKKKFFLPFSHCYLFLFLYIGRTVLIFLVDRVSPTSARFLLSIDTLPVSPRNDKIHSYHSY